MEQRLLELDGLRSRGVISEQEYGTARMNVLVGGNTNNTAPAPAPVSGLPIPTTNPMELAGVQVELTPLVRCPEGHHMELVESVIVASNTDEGTRLSREYEPMCVSCYIKIPKSDGGFFICKSCPYRVSSINTWRHVCKSCALSNKHLRFGRGNEPRVKWDQCQDGPYCMDSFLCFYCLLGQFTLFGVNKGLPADGSEPTFGCVGCCCASMFALMDPLSLGIFSSALLCEWNVRAAHWFDMNEPHRTSQCSTCMQAYFCRCCVLAQFGNELAAHQLYPGGVCFSKRPASCPPVPPRPQPPMLSIQPNPNVLGGTSPPGLAVAGPYQSVPAQPQAPLPPAPGVYEQQGLTQQQSGSVYGAADYTAPPPLKFAGTNEFDLRK